MKIKIISTGKLKNKRAREGLLNARSEAVLSKELVTIDTLLTRWQNYFCLNRFIDQLQLFKTKNIINN